MAAAVAAATEGTARQGRPMVYKARRSSHGESAKRQGQEEGRQRQSPQRMAVGADHRLGAGVHLHVHPSAGQDQPGPGHPRRPVGGAVGEKHRRRRSDLRGYGEVARHHRAARQRARRLRGRGAAAGLRPDPRADPWPFRYGDGAVHHRQNRQAGVRAPGFVHR